jgi:hypothetical protein
MKSATTLCVLLVLAIRPVVVPAQESPAAEENAAPAAEVRTAEPPAAEPAASPAPGEEVMRPTERGLRFTPKMAMGLAQAIASDFPDRSGRDEFARRMERRCWELKEKHGQEAAVAAECFFETLVLQEGRGNLPDNNKAFYLSFDADSAREFSRKVAPGVKLLEEFWQGLLDDARQIGPADKIRDMLRNAEEALEMTRRFEEKMDRWSRGEVKPNEGLLDGIDEDDIAAEKAGKSKEYMQAEREERWQVDTAGPVQWEWFLNQCVKVFDFDDAQKAAGRQVLVTYRKKADAIMTRDWKARALANRVLQHLRWLCPNEPLEPWAFRLDQEYKQMKRPIEEMGVSFRREVVALARPQQQERMLAELRKLGSDHGMKPDELDSLLVMPASQPASR